MKGTLILLVVIAATACLARYALAEGQKIEKRKKKK
jgi:hypothetical protein